MQLLHGDPQSDTTPKMCCPNVWHSVTPTPPIKTNPGLAHSTNNCKLWQGASLPLTCPGLFVLLFGTLALPGVGNSDKGAFSLDKGTKGSRAGNN